VVDTDNGGELLIPAQEDFIVGIDKERGVVTVELPEGLVNMDSALSE
jgi:16S rRNA processing protein RimM